MFVQLYQKYHNDTYQIYSCMLGIWHIACFTIVMPIICITSSGIKTTYYLDNKYMGLSLFAMRDIISHTFRQPPDFIWLPYIMALASSETRLSSLGRVIRACGLMTRVFPLFFTNGQGGIHTLLGVMPASILLLWWLILFGHKIYRYII